MGYLSSHKEYWTSSSVFFNFWEPHCVIPTSTESVIAFTKFHSPPWYWRNPWPTTYVVTLLYWNLYFVRYMASLVVKNEQQKDMCFSEIGLYAQKHRHHSKLNNEWTICLRAYVITWREGESSLWPPNLISTSILRHDSLSDLQFLNGSNNFRYSPTTIIVCGVISAHNSAQHMFQWWNTFCTLWPWRTHA